LPPQVEQTSFSEQENKKRMESVSVFQLIYVLLFIPRFLPIRSMGILDLLLMLQNSRHLESVNQCSDIRRLMVVHHFHKHLLVRPLGSCRIWLQKHCLLLLLLFLLRLLLVPPLLRYICSSCFCQFVSALGLCELSKIRRLLKSDIFSIRTNEELTQCVTFLVRP